MQRERLLFGLAAVLAGIATLEFVLGFVYSPVLFAVAVPFAAAAYLVWYHASGRLRDRVESGRAGSYRGAGDPRADADRGGSRGGFGAGPRESYSERRGGFGGRGARGGGSRAGGGPAGGRAGVQQNAGLGPTEAYRVLDLDPGADAEAVRRAYREKVKTVHPDRESGDEEAFKRVTEAYEVLRERT